MIRTIKFTVVKAIGIKIQEGVPKTEGLKELKYTGRKMSRKAIEEHYSKELQEKGLTSLAYEEEEIIKQYEISLEDFLSLAKEVEEDKEETKQEIV